MPIHKGIQISVISQWELSIHPEFPHPEASDHRKDLAVKKKRSIPTTALSESLAQSSISVYIPSVKGARFWIRYSVLEPQAKECELWYFKLYMNGRHITSWGIDTKKKASGQVMRGLFEPSDRWNFKEKGKLYKSNGTEARPFFFANQAEARSAAIDGGSLMVIAYRAKARKRRFAVIQPFRNQEKYGIAMPSGGLIDKPQDVKYYDWHLVDPKDEPYAVFRIHYRSWEYLEALNLIPPRHPRTLLPTTPSILSLNRNPDLREEVDPEQDWETVNTGSPSNAASPVSNKSSPSSSRWISDVFEDSQKLARAKVEKEISPVKKRPSSLDVNPLRLNPIEPSPPMRSRPLSNSSDLEDPFWTGGSVRPLPQIPSSRRSSRQREEPSSPTQSHSRKSSAASHSPSIAPSLIAYAERESTNSPEPVIRIAAAVPFLLPAKRATEIDAATANDSSFESSANDPGPPTPPPKDDLDAIQPVILTPNVTIRKHRHSASRHTSSAIGNGAATGTISPTESEWMCRTPSPPTKEITEYANIGSLWSPRVDQKQKEKHKELKSKKHHLPLKYRENDGKEERGKQERLVRPDKGTHAGRDDEEVKIRPGNWI